MYALRKLMLNLMICTGLGTLREQPGPFMTCPYSWLGHKGSYSGLYFLTPQGKFVLNECMNEWVSE